MLALEEGICPAPIAGVLIREFEKIVRIPFVSFLFFFFAYLSRVKRRVLANAGASIFALIPCQRLFGAFSDGFKVFAHYLSPLSRTAIFASSLS